MDRPTAPELTAPLVDEAFYAGDPFPTYARLRAEAPIVWHQPDEGPGWWIVSTLAEVLDRLCDDGYVYRYAVDGEPPGSAEGAFLLCGFVLGLAQLHEGDRVGAVRSFERNRAACGPPGLLSEEFDVRQRQLRGNLPQAFVHALLLELSVRT